MVIATDVLVYACLLTQALTGSLIVIGVYVKLLLVYISHFCFFGEKLPCQIGALIDINVS
jgi:hypothetical protein